jgi:hypothetical protein
VIARGLGHALSTDIVYVLVAIVRFLMHLLTGLRTRIPEM